MTSTKRTDVLILGAGIIGLASAYYLQEQGRSVRIVDVGEIGAGASPGNLGLVSPSHAGPLARPGMIQKVLRWTLDPKSPFFARPTLSPTRLKWFLDFARRCNMRDFDVSARGRSALLLTARSLYDELMEKHALDCEWEAIGMYMVYKTREAMEQAEPLEEHVRQFGVISEAVYRDELLRREPALSEDVYGAHYFPQDAHLRPDSLVSEMARLVRERGGVIDENCGEVAMSTARGQVDGVVVGSGGVGEGGTERRVFHAREYVVATGAWTPMVMAPLGVGIPIQPGKGYSITVDRPELCPKQSCILAECNMAVTPWGSGLRLGGTMELAGYREGLNDARIEAIFAGASGYFREPVKPGVGEQERWFGWRPMTTDGMPIIGPVPGHPNVTVAAGHGMLGVSAAPSTGKLVAALVTGTEPPVDPNPYRVDRF